MHRNRIGALLIVSESPATRQVDGGEVHVAMGNRRVLRIARKDIVLNQQNMRWECEAKNTRRDKALRKPSLI